MWTDRETIQLLLPEILLVVMATWIYIAGTISRGRLWWCTFSVITYVIAGLLLIRIEAPIWEALLKDGVASPQGPLAVDLFGQLIRWLGLCCGVLFTLMASQTAKRNLASEHFATIMILVVGLMLSARANELVFLFVSLEMVSIPTYVLLYLGRRERLAAEAAAKYFFLSIVSSALLLYGLSFVYGMSGTTVISGFGEVPGIREVLAAKLQSGQSLEVVATIAMVLIFAGLGFKIAAVPFHFYAPDVYQGVTNANAGLLAVAPKLAGIAALVRLTTAIASQTSFAWQLLLVGAILTMTLGNVCALWQSNLRRLLAYSSIAHSGYMLIGVSVGLAFHGSTVGVGGIGATLFYLYVYVLGSLASFAALSWLSSDERQCSNVDQLAGMGKTHVGVSAALAISMFSLAGIPPLAGFWGKLTLFGGAIQMSLASEDVRVSIWFVLLALAGAINAAIAATYYLRIVSVLYFQPSANETPASGGLGAWLACTGSALLVLAIGFSPGLAIQHTGQAEKAFARQGLSESSPIGMNTQQTVPPSETTHVMQRER